MKKRIAHILFVCFLSISSGCTDSPAGQPILTAEIPLQLVHHLGEARIHGSDASIGADEPIEWSFGAAGAKWKPFADPEGGPEIPRSPAKTEITEDAIRVVLSEKNRDIPWRPYSGMIYSELSGLNREDWSHVVVRARAVQPGRISLISVGKDRFPH
jgi:hypothetical protein